ncbi:hypothetical protein BDW02DRAFT_623475, partial [Decorospora gaudefroyi]
WTNVRPEGDGERFTQRSNERRQLFEEAKNRGNHTDLSPVTWAFFQVADLKRVKQHVYNDDVWKLVVENGPYDEIFLDVVRLWKQAPVAKTKMSTGTTSHSITTNSNKAPSSPAPPNVATQTSTRSTRLKRKHGGQEFSLARSANVAARCKERDSNLCAVSRMGAIDAAHIYPWCAFGSGGTERVNNFWRVLSMFWGQEEVSNWKSKIFVDANDPSRRTETVENMLSLTATLHRFHSDDVFALRPIQMSQDNAQLELEFHWLVIEERKSNNRVSLLDEPLSSLDRKLSGKGYGPFIGSIP